MRVIIVGGGIGGLCLAQGLRKRHIDVAVFEQQRSPTENLAGYGIHIDAHGRAALRTCLPLEAWGAFCEMSTPAGSTLCFRDESLDLLAERDDARLTGKPASAVERRGIGRLELRGLLLEGLQDASAPIIRWGKKFSRYEPLPNGKVRAHFEDGSTEEGDLLVGADASHSRVRQQCLPQLQRENLGILTIAGRYLLNDSRVSTLPRPLTDGSLNNIVPAGPGWMFVSSWHSRPEAAAGNATRAQHYVTWAYVVPKDKTPLDQHALNADALKAIVERGIKGWSWALSTVVRDADITTVAPVFLHSMPLLEPWTPGNVTLLGDAIHNMTPLAGIGANTALRDAGVLAKVLEDCSRGHRTLLEAIHDYESQMRAYANRAVGMSRDNAIRASTGKPLGRHLFRGLLRLAHLLPPVMKATLGRSAKH